MNFAFSFHHNGRCLLPDENSVSDNCSFLSCSSSSLHSPAPTLEEVNAWAQSFDKLMLTPAGRNAFREFLRTEFSEENMLFWMACEELKQESNKSVIEEKARLIYEDYISILSPKEVYYFPHSLMLFCMVEVFKARGIPGGNSLSPTFHC